MNFNNWFLRRSWPDPFRSMCNGKSDPPPAPDYTGAANATAAGNAEAARIAANANRVDQITPYGNLTYSQTDPNNQDHWTATTTLSPAQEKLLESQNKVSLGLGDLSQQGLGYVQNMLNKPFDQSALPEFPIEAGQTAQDAIMARMQPQLDRDQDRLQNQLINQGLPQNSEAYNTSMDAFNRQKNDAYQQAGLAGINAGQQARQQSIQEQAFFRNEPLNTLNAVRSGAQVTNPSFINVPQQATTAGPDLVNAATQQYNAAVGGTNASNAQAGQTAGTVGTIAASAAMMI